MSTFTIHPAPNDDPEIISVNNAMDNDYLAKYIIPSKSKSGIKSALFNLGYKPHIVFPDISNIYSTIQYEISQDLRHQNHHKSIN